MGNAVIEGRLDTRPGLRDRARLLPASEVKRRVTALMAALADPAASGYVRAGVYDGRDEPVSAAADWLRGQGVVSAHVSAYWLYDRAGIAIAMADFLDNLELLWYPSADDVLLESTLGDFILVIDHEEHLQLFRRRAPQRGDVLP